MHFCTVFLFRQTSMAMYILYNSISILRCDWKVAFESFPTLLNFFIFKFVLWVLYSVTEDEVTVLLYTKCMACPVQMITISTKKATKVKSVIELFMIFPLSPILQFKKLQTINIEICQFKMMQNCLSVVSKHVHEWARTHGPRI